MRPTTPSARPRYPTPWVALAAALIACAQVAVEPVPAAPPEPEPVVRAATLAEVERITPDDLGRLVTSGGERPRIVNFWATWCGPCQIEIPHLVEFGAAHPQFEIVLVSLDLPSLEKQVAKFVEKQDIRGVRVVLVDSTDPGGVAARMVPGWNDTIPMTLLLRTDGTRAATFLHAVTREELEAKVAEKMPGAGIEPALP